MDAQNSSQIQRNLITDILNNIENLYKVTNKREVEKIQDEFYHIYAQNDLQELKRFHKELDLIAEGYRARGNYRRTLEQKGINGYDHTAGSL